MHLRARVPEETEHGGIGFFGDEGVLVEFGIGSVKDRTVAMSADNLESRAVEPDANGVDAEREE